MADYPCDFGNYLLLAELGRGAMGVVYKAEQKSLGRAVALKVLNSSKDWAADGDIARFRREGEVMARLSHPDIVAVHDFGVHGDRLYISMDLVSGWSLDRWMRAQFPTVEQALTITARVARALYMAHEHGIVHRDVKPSNILLDHNGNPKLSDFGLAKVEGAKLSQSGGLLGTPVYMSPEQALGETVDARSDLYSLGAVLYEMLTGGPPVTGTTIEAVVHEVAHGNPIPPRALNPKVPRDVETICLKALAKHRDQRYPTALAFAEDIERYLRGESIRASRAGWVERGWFWARRNRATVAVAAVACAVVTVLAAVSLRLSARVEEQRKLSREREDLERAAAEAERLYRKREYAQAIAPLQRLKDTPLDVPIRRLHRAICLREAGRRDEAEREFEDYLGRFPEDAAAWRHRGLNALEGGRVADAIPSYREAARAAGVPLTDETERFGDYDALVALVERHFLQDHPRPLLASYTPFYDFNRRSDYELLQREFPHANWRLDDWTERFPVWDYPELGIDEWIEKYGEHPALVGWRASEVLDQEPRRALDDLDRVLTLVPIARWPRYMMIRALLLLGRFAEAESHAEILRALCPRDPYTLYNVARARRATGDWLRAALDFERMGDGAKSSRSLAASTALDSYESGAQCAARAGDAAVAARLLRKAMAAGSSDAGNRKRIEADPVFQLVLETREFQEYLDSLDPHNGAFFKGLDRLAFDPWERPAAGTWCRYRMTMDDREYAVGLYRRKEPRFPIATMYERDGRMVRSTMFELPAVSELRAPVDREETIRVPMGEFRCRTATVPVPGGEVQVWISEDVPFLIVKKENRVAGKVVRIELVAVEKP